MVKIASVSIVLILMGEQVDWLTNPNPESLITKRIYALQTFHKFSVSSVGGGDVDCRCSLPVKTFYYMANFCNTLIICT